MYTATITVKEGENFVSLGDLPLQISIVLQMPAQQATVKPIEPTIESIQPNEEFCVIDFCRKVSADFLANGQANSSNDYKYLANLIAKISPNGLFFKDFTAEWLEKVETYCTKRGIRGLGYFRHLKALFNKAVQKRLVCFKQNPFKNTHTNPYGFDISRLKKKRLPPKGEGRIKDLTKDQLTQVLAYRPESEAEKKYLNMWQFSYYTFGVNLTDIAYLKHEDIKDNRWFYQRSKTGSGLPKGKPLLQEAIDIINAHDTEGSYIFDILKDKYAECHLAAANRIHCYAKYITTFTKKLSKKLGFPIPFTFYSARYTSATIALNAGADRNSVSHLLDHSNFSTLDRYVGRADDDGVVRAMEVLRV